MRTPKSVGQVLHLGSHLGTVPLHSHAARRLGFIFLSKLYRQMYAGTGISTDSARRKKSKRWARWTARQCKKLFQARPMPELEGPKWELGMPDAPRLRLKARMAEVSGAVRYDFKG